MDGKVKKKKGILPLTVGLCACAALISIPFAKDRTLPQDTLYTAAESGSFIGSIGHENSRGSTLSSSSSMPIPESPRLGFLTAHEVPMILQNPELPTGCEATAAAMLLQAYGYRVDKCAVADALPRAEKHTIDGTVYIQHPEEAFNGNPGRSGFGVFSPVLADTVQQFIDMQGGSDQAVAMKGKTEEELLSLIDEGLPVCVWTTMCDAEVGKGASWYVLRDGKPTQELFVWPKNEHCVVLTGYTDSDVSVLDPMHGRVTYPRNSFFRHYSDVGGYAMIIV